MPGKVIYIDELKGLQEAAVPALQQQYGKNTFQAEKPRRFLHIVKDIVLEPMFMLLVVACILYFLLGEPAEGIMMMAAITLVAAIALYQDIRSTRALEALKEFTTPDVTVIRDGIEKSIRSEELVSGDVVLLEEGNKVPADAEIIQANDLSINEAIITGEAFPVEKHEKAGYDIIYQGTTINSGKCYAVVIATGNNTVLGKIGKSVSAYAAPKTLLQQQVNRFIRWLAFFGISAFVAIWLINLLKTGLFFQSILFGLTLAMAAIPEEIPVAFSSFMALGAWRMSKLGIITRQPQIIENLGSVSMICLDKTGTITENKMTVTVVYDFENDLLTETVEQLNNSDVLGYAMLASEQHPFDAMEIAIHDAYLKYSTHDRFSSFKQVYEYPLQGTPPMMTHVYEYTTGKIVAAKGAAERILTVCRLDGATRKRITGHIIAQAEKGYRVIGVASAVHASEVFPASQDTFNWKFEGFVSLYDPPKQNIRSVIQQFYDAKIGVMLLTGDFPETAVNIAGKAGISGNLKYLTGEQVMNMNDQELSESVKQVTIFARMFPEAKKRVINTLKLNGHIVAMTGDGVNDAPALRAADIGIAMGKKGTEIAKQAADLVITDDNLEKVVEAIQEGRKIFNNLKKAIRYIISIHIPIILTASLPLLLGWKYPNIFTPVHIIFLELIMGPTCSIFFEREPVETNLMRLPPRNRAIGLFAQDELLISIVQGLVITAGALWLYYFSVSNNSSLEVTRTMVFTTLLAANVFLTFTNRSFTENFTKTARYKNNLAPWLLLASISFLAIIHLVAPVRQLFGLAPVPFTNVLICIGVAFVSVLWLELYKLHPFKPAPSVIPRRR
jgi:P-type Ca2+ transporter type 2C